MFQEVSEGQFTEHIAPYLMQAAPFAGVDRLPFQQALQNAVRDKRKVLLSVLATCLPHHAHLMQPDQLHKLHSQLSSQLECWSCMPLSCPASRCCFVTVVATDEAANGSASNTIAVACRLWNHWKVCACWSKISLAAAACLQSGQASVWPSTSPEPTPVALLSGTTLPLLAPIELPMFRFMPSIACKVFTIGISLSMQNVLMTADLAWIES